jgi:hypothetical protein
MQLLSLTYNPWAGPQDSEGLLDWTSHGCKINAVSLEDLLVRYEASKFLDRTKGDTLAPDLDAVSDTWERMLSAGEELRRVITFESEDGRRWGSVDAWLSGPGTWAVQHLAANGGGVGSRASILTSVARCLADPDFIAAESWFRPSNPFPHRVLGDSVDAIGEDVSSRSDCEYLAVNARCVPGTRALVSEVRDAAGDLLDLLDLLGRSHTKVNIVTKGVTRDLGLEGVDAIYRMVGLRRYRRTWLARSRSGDCLGAVLAHRGPVGLNFSFLENRCDLVLFPGLAPELAADAAAGLLAAAADAYEDFSPGFIPVATPAACAPAVVWMGASAIRTTVVGGQAPEATYSHISWLRPGLAALAQYFNAAIRPGFRRLSTVPA